jgi:hypothetical protein
MGGWLALFAFRSRKRQVPDPSFQSKLLIQVFDPGA